MKKYSMDRVIVFIAVVFLFSAMDINAQSAEKKINIFVVDKIVETSENNSSETISYEYTSTGRIKSITNESKFPDDPTLNDISKDIFKYDKKGHFKSRVIKSNKFGTVSNYSYKYDKKGRVISIIDDGYLIISLKYNKNGKCTRYKDSMTNRDHNYSYNKSGAISGVSAKVAGDYPSTFKMTIKYDKHNSILSTSEKGIDEDKKNYSIKQIYKNKYSNGRLSEQIESHVLTNTLNQKIIYKKISLTKNQIKKVRPQQRWIIQRFCLGDSCPPVESCY